MPPLLPILSIEDIQARLKLIFPESFPDRTILVSDMSARAHFVMRYGDFIDGSGHYFRPSTIIRFSLEQAARTADSDRYDWRSQCHLPGFHPVGKQWYADNTRETLRDDLVRNRMIPMGLIRKREGIPPTSPAPIYALAKPYAELFNPDLTGNDLVETIKTWQNRYLDPRTLTRMRLLAHGIFEREGDIPVKLPSGKVLRLAPGEASIITRDVCEVMAPAFCHKPVVVHISMSDRKIFPELATEAHVLGLELDPKAALPDVIIVNVTRDATQLVFVEVVHSDGPITELRRDTLLEIAKGLGYGVDDVTLVTAFEDRNSDVFRKRFSEIARGSWVWFRSEPHLAMELKILGNRH